MYGCLSWVWSLDKALPSKLYCAQYRVILYRDILRVYSNGPLFIWFALYIHGLVNIHYRCNIENKIWIILNSWSSAVLLWKKGVRDHRSPTTQDFVGGLSGCVFDIATLQCIDKGVPILLAGFQLSRYEFCNTNIFQLPCIRTAIKTVFLVSTSQVSSQNDFELHK